MKFKRKSDKVVLRAPAPLVDRDVEFHRCVPGRKTVDKACNMHNEHHWCDACEGWYGVPHELRGCHTMQAKVSKLPPGTSRPSPGQCACRFCKDVVKLGYVAAQLLHEGQHVA